MVDRGLVSFSERDSVVALILARTEASRLHKRVRYFFPRLDGLEFAFGIVKQSDLAEAGSSEAPNLLRYDNCFRLEVVVERV